MTHAEQAEFEALKQKNAALQAEVESARAAKEVLQHKYDVLFQLAFGPRSERRIDETLSESNARQGFLFLVELTDQAERLAQETGAETRLEGRSVGEPGKRPARRKKFPAHLPRVRTTVEIPEAERMCCGSVMQEMKEEITRELERVELTVVHEIARKVYICRTCQESVRTAPAMPRVIDKGILGVGFLSHVLTDRFLNHQPYHRQEKKFQSEGLDLSRAVLCQSALRCAELLKPIWEQLRSEVVKSPVVHTDETPVNLQSSSQGGRRKARVWVYLDLEGRTVYDFTESRSRDGPETVLEGYTGYVQADAASTFDTLFGPGGATEVGCWAHARRYFVRAEDSDAELSAQAIRRIRRLFDIERSATEQELSPDQRQELRQEQAVPLLNELKAWLDLTQTQVLPKSPMGRAIQYCLNQWDALTRYPEDGLLSIDNNSAERALRAVAVGRKNWVIVGNPRGGEAAAILYSLVMTCKEAGVHPWEYFRDVLLRIATCSDAAKLTPHGWKQHFQQDVHERRDRIVAKLLESACRHQEELAGSL
jgi:transposase